MFTPVFAYIDPGSGALVWQALVAGVIGAGYYFRKFFGRLFHRRPSEQPSSPRPE